MRHRKATCKGVVNSPDRWQHGSKSDHKCPRPSSATSIGLRWRNSNRPDRARLPQPSGARRRSGHSNRDFSRTGSDGVRRLLSLCSGLAVHLRRLISLRSSQFSRPAFSAAHFLDGFGPIPAPGSFAVYTFPAPPPSSTGPSHKAPARLGSSDLSLWVPQKNGAEKGNIFVSYLFVFV